MEERRGGIGTDNESIAKHIEKDRQVLPGWSRVGFCPTTGLARIRFGSRSSGERNETRTRSCFDPAYGKSRPGTDPAAGRLFLDRMVEGFLLGRG